MQPQLKMYYYEGDDKNKWSYWHTSMPDGYHNIYIYTYSLVFIDGEINHKWLGKSETNII